MQDNVTQAVACRWRYRYSSGTVSNWTHRAGVIEPQEGTDREAATEVEPLYLASTAQPEVKGLVEAVERSAKMIDKAASAAAGQDFPALAEALDNIEFRLRQALAAYREAQP